MKKVKRVKRIKSASQIRKIKAKKIKPVKHYTRTQIIKRCAFIRWTLFIFLVFVCTIIMSTGGSIKPILFIPLCAAICMNEGEYPATALGASCGLLLDIASGRLFGYNAVFLIVISVLTSLLFKHYLLQNWVNVLLLTTAYSAVHEILDYFFMYAMWNYESSGKIFSSVSVPCFIYTVISAPFVYLVIKPIIKHFYPKRAKTMDEAMKA